MTNPFAGFITDPNSTIGSSFQQIQYYQLLLPYPQFTGVSTEPQLIANSIYHGLQLTRREEVLERSAISGNLHLVEIDR